MNRQSSVFDPSTKYPSTNPSGQTTSNNLVNAPPSAVNITGLSSIQLNEVSKVPGRVTLRRSQDSEEQRAYLSQQHINVIRNPVNGEQYRNRIEGIVSRNSGLTHRRSESDVIGTSQFIGQQRQHKILELIQQKLKQINLKTGVNQGHGNHFQKNNQELPLWLLSRGHQA